MADNVLVANDDQTDFTVATDDDGTAQHQYVKVEFGADNTQTKVTSSAGLPVKIVESGTATPITQSGTWTVQPGNTPNTTAWKVDGSAVTQPVSVASAVAVTDNSGSLTVDNSSLSVVGGGTEATAMRVTIATDSTGVLSVDDNGSTISIDDGAGNISIDDGGNSITVDDGSGSLTVDNAGTFATQAAQSGTWTVQPGNTANTTAWKVDGSAVTQPVSGTVTANAGTGTFTAKETRAATSALTTVADNAASTSILASNANRLKAVITNDSSARLYLRFEAAAASTSNYMVSLAQHETWEELFYTGEIRGIWATDPNDGAARVTEFTA